MAFLKILIRTESKQFHTYNGCKKIEVLHTENKTLKILSVLTVHKKI